ncbi:hypothetical protein FQA47_018309 [Oryzias melastigma]|uniref:Uncharacterized protein n=1 Tax=Oryzias melastigma TaxID=30732 RepID=A0A834FRW2_ORYME|nr:hypothetical protein FQA47_018309 [Oryzias melastigma]
MLDPNTSVVQSSELHLLLRTGGFWVKAAKNRILSSPRLNAELLISRANMEFRERFWNSRLLQDVPERSSIISSGFLPSGGNSELQTGSQRTAAIMR